MRRLALPFAAALALAAPAPACGSSGGVVRTAQDNTAEPPPAAAPAAPEDSYDGFAGKRVPLGERFRLWKEPVGVDALRATVRLVKLEWSVLTHPSGAEEKSATATLETAHGDETRRRRIDQEGTKVVGDVVKVTVHEAGEDYDDATAKWHPWVVVSFSKP